MKACNTLFPADFTTQRTSKENTKFGIEFAWTERIAIFTIIVLSSAQKPEHIKMDFSYTDILVSAWRVADLC